MRGPGLRGRIVLAVGSIIILIMVLMSWGILYRWRQGAVNREEVSALAVSRAFSVAVLDALIYADQGYDQPEGVLDHYIDLFMTQNRRIRSITILDPQGELVARSWESPTGLFPAQDRRRLPPLPGPRTIIDTDEAGNWLLDVVMPLRSGRRSWGVVDISFEAQSVRARISRVFFLLMVFSTSVTSILLLLLWLILGRILGSLQGLETAMETVDFESGHVPPLPHRSDEIGRLYQGFRRMGERLRQSRRDLLSAEKQVWHAERLAAIGRLASGLAHELNNPIHGVRHCIYVIKADPDNREQTIQYLDMMEEGLAHAADVIEKLLGFARKQAVGLKAVVLNDSTEAVLRLINFRLERDGARILTDLPPDLPLVMADPQLLQEVIMNLLINAADAVGKGGCIQVRTRAQGETVALEVRDDGPGIPHELQDQIFDPFFTTKDPGQGTGLGLSISLGIIQALGGNLAVVSEPGKGTVFTVTLPMADQTSEQTSDHSLADASLPNSSPFLTRTIHEDPAG
ncbi:hypothetical protein CSB20_01320 [bacterium DOLZORAL124_64_63]|nr:MAG: hypothetical protein CSB20_01320 [bacterium DOLZORAL124_64_63]